MNINIGIGQVFSVAFGDGETKISGVVSTEGLGGVVFTAPVHPAAKVMMKRRMQTPK